MDAYNAAVQGWGRDSLGHLQRAMAGLSVRQTGQLARELKVHFGKRHGQVVNVAYTFPRYAVFVEKGAGRGYGGKKGSQWYTGGARRRTAKESLGRMGSGNRPAKPFFNPTMDERVSALADLVVKYYADFAVGELKIK